MFKQIGNSMQCNRVTNRILMTAGIIGLATLGVTGCSSSNDAEGGDASQPVNAENIVGTWVMEQGEGPGGSFEAVAGAEVSLTVEEDGTFFGPTGCNSVSGQMTITDGTIDMGPGVAQTQMFCDGPGMELEDKYTPAFADIDEGVVAGDILTLVGPDASIAYKKEG